MATYGVWQQMFGLFLLSFSHAEKLTVLQYNKWRKSNHQTLTQRRVDIGNYMGVSENYGYPKMDGLEWKTLLKWMIWGYHYFRKHPYDIISTTSSNWTWHPPKLPCHFLLRCPSTTITLQPFMTWGGHERSQDFYKVGDPRLVEASLEIFQALLMLTGPGTTPQVF